MGESSHTWLALDDLPFDPGSFRDPAGRVLQRDGRVLRVLAPRAADEVAWLRERGIIDALTTSGQLVPTWDVDRADVGLERPPIAQVLEHERLPFVSYPYEWCFSALRAAALLHLDVQLELLARGATLIDASAYNVQFKGARPIFIDVLSLRRYRDGELWAGHRQFCEQFLNPLLLQALRGISFNRWYRGSPEGIPVGDVARLLTFRDKLSWRTLLHVVAQAKLQNVARARQFPPEPPRGRRLPKASLVSLLKGLRSWIVGLSARKPKGGWSDYSTTHTYAEEDVLAKRRFVAEFAAASRPRLLVDLGCNIGEYAAVALDAGARLVIGLEADPASADAAFRRADQQELSFLPLVMDAADPSPACGWREAERRSLSQRAPFDGLLALAFEHHLAIGRNVPLDQLAAWLTGLAPRGVIEFVEKDDPTIQQMLALREDVFAEYSLRDFTATLSRHARIVRQQRVSASGRVLFWYDRE